LPRQPLGGDRVVNLELAATLEAIAAGGRDAHYTGAWGKAAVAAVEAEGGELALEDLAAHGGEWVDPISVGYRGRQILELPPNGQGAAGLAALTELAPAPRGPAGHPDTVDRTMRAVRQGMEAAYEHVADPRTAAIPPFWQARDTVYTAV